jgi:hypothetical protein
VSRWLVAGLLVGLELSQAVLAHPYYLSYYNPLLGGGASAQRALLIGWGEGMDAVGAYLRSRPDIRSGAVLSALGATLQPFVPAPVRDVEQIDDGPANYAVVYLESVQRDANRAIYDRIRQTVPLHTVTVRGIDYAQIYQLPRPFAKPIDARFGDGLNLRGVTSKLTGKQLLVTLAWDVRAQPKTDASLFLHLIDERGQRVAQVDVAPGGSGSQTSAWQPGEQIAVPIELKLPAELTPGTYRLTLGLYDSASGTRLKPVGGAPADPALDGADALLIDTVTLR